MKPILSLLMLLGAVVTCQASYFEDWIIEGKVISVCGKEETAQILADKPDISVFGKNFIGLQIKLTNCIPVGGHGGTKCKNGLTRVIVLSYDPNLMKAPPAKDMLLKIRYSYSDSARKTSSRYGPGCCVNPSNLFLIFPKSTITLTIRNVRLTEIHYIS